MDGRSIWNSREIARDFANLRPIKQELVLDAIWSVVPEAIKKDFAVLGSPDRDVVFAGFKVEGGRYLLNERGRVIPQFLNSAQFSKSEEARDHRAREVMRLYLKQGGTDIYRADGRYMLSPKGVTIDHMVPRAASENKMWDDPSNWVITRRGLNLVKSNKSLKGPSALA